MFAHLHGIKRQSRKENDKRTHKISNSTMDYLG